MKKSLIVFIIVLFTLGILYSQVQVKKREQQKPQLLSNIKVVYPNDREEWEKGERYTIRWTSQGIKGNVKIMLKYGPGRGSWYTIKENTPNTGSYAFTVPAEFLQGEDSYEQYWFFIFVMTLDEKIKDGSDKSFIIRTKPEIRLIFPNGGEN